MRGYKTLIQQAELMAMSPEAVTKFLKRRAEQPYWDELNDPVDEDVEKALHSRDDPLISLALARYGRHMEVVSEIFQAASPGSSIRLACLSNRALGHGIFLSFPVGLFGRDPRRMAEWLLSASEDELGALFENPNLSDSFLRDLLERSKGWESINDDKLVIFVFFLHRNLRMRTPREDDRMDGYDEYSYSSVFNAAWKLAETAPPTNDWASVLGELYEQLEPEAFSIKQPLALATRWCINPGVGEANEQLTKALAFGHLSHKERVRKGLARLALHQNYQLLAELLSSDDIALRAAAYAAGKLNVGQLLAGYEKDRDLAYNEAIRNLALWRQQPTRQALHDIAWDCVDHDKHSDLHAANLYNWMEKDMRKKHPDWFTDKEDEEPAYHKPNDQAPAIGKIFQSTGEVVCQILIFATLIVYFFSLFQMKLPEKVENFAVISSTIFAMILSFAAFASWGASSLLNIRLVRVAESIEQSILENDHIKRVGRAIKEADRMSHDYVGPAGVVVGISFIEIVLSIYLASLISNYLG